MSARCRKGAVIKVKSYSTQNVPRTVLVNVAKTLLACSETCHSRGNVSESSEAHVLLTTEAQNHHDNNDRDDGGFNWFSLFEEEAC